MHFPVHFPRQSRAKRTHFSSCLLLHSDQPTLSSSSALFCAPANPRFLSHQHVLRPSETPTPSAASALVFHSKRTCLPLQGTCLPLPKRLPPHCQSVCLPPPTQSSSTTRTFGFLCQNVRFPLPARSAFPVRTLVIRSQPNHTPNRPALLHPLMLQGQHADVAQHAALAVMVSARQASMRCGGEP